ncbi:MAG: potassium transporter KtrB [Deltaproteobacteria bacterium]|nr:potassium transporter KtrB [Deltaproteobacteria bacterium]
MGWLFLSLPVSTVASKVSALDLLFISTSAVSTTGLATASTGNDFTLFGQIIILILIQLGGLGYMTCGSFVVLSRSATLSARRQNVGKTVFSMPQEFRVDKFIRSVIVFTLITEVIGAIALYIAFMNAGISNPLWTSIFHSVSAFCTAGFSLYDNSFEAFQGNVPVNIILGILSYLGAIGFIVFVDGWRCIIGKTKRLTLTSRIIISTTLWLSVAGVILFFVAEPNIQHLPPYDRIVTSSFQVMNAITTTGFNSIPIGGLSTASLFLIIMLMIIGASPSGTGGGLKTTTFTAAFGMIRSVIRGHERVTFWGKEIPEERMRLAISSIGFYIMALIIGCYLLALAENHPFEGLLFEAASALGTVGLSTGITGVLSPIGKLIIIMLMFVGRLGPLLFGIALFLPANTAGDEIKEDLAI